MHNQISLALGGCVDPLTARFNAIVAAAAARYRARLGVTGTLTASAWTDQTGNGRHLVQATGANQPHHVPFVGVPYAWFSGAPGNSFTTPDSSSLDPASNVVGFVVRAAANDWTSSDAADGCFIAKAVGSGENAYGFRIYPPSDGKLAAYVSYDGTANIFTTSAAYSLTDASWYWLAAVIDANLGTCRYYTAADTGDNATLPSSWTQLGSTITGLTTGTIKASTSPLTVGRDISTNIFGGKIGRAVVYDGVPPTFGGAGVAMADFNASDFAETSANGATAVSTATGETWTLNSTGSLPCRIVKAPILIGEGTARKMATANFTLNQPVEHFMVVQPISWGAGDYMLSGTVAQAGITQVTSTPNIGLNAGSAAAENTGATLGSFCIVHAAINGASSSVTVNAGAAATGNAGANNPGGLALFSNQAGGGYFNGAVKEWIVFGGTLTAADRSVVRTVMNREHRCY